MCNQEPEELLSMPFLDHFEDLRKRLIYSLIGFVAAYFVSLTFSNELWSFISQPASAVLLHLGYPPAEAKLVIGSPGEGFAIVWMKLPLVAAIYLASHRGSCIRRGASWLRDSTGRSGAGRRDA